MRSNNLAYTLVFIGSLGFCACETSDDSFAPIGVGGGGGGASSGSNTGAGDSGGGQDGDTSGGQDNDSNGNNGNSGGGNSDIIEGQLGFRDCDSTSPMVGRVAELVGRSIYSDIMGSVEIIDDCTLLFRDVRSNGVGIRLYAYGGQSVNNFIGAGSGFFFGPEIFSVDGQTVLATQGSRDLANDGVRGTGPELDPFVQRGRNTVQDFLVQMKPGREIEELGALSIWCEPATVSFAEGVFVDP